MKLINRFYLCALLFCLPAFALASKTFDESLLLGSWNCKQQLKDIKTKMNVNIDYHINFTKGGASKGSGVISFTLIGLPEIEYSIKNRATWKIEKGKLHLSSSEIKAKNISHPELEALLSLDTFIPKQVNESSKIVTLMRNRLEVQSRSGKGVYACTKAR